MAWYHDKQRTTYIATYKDEKQLRKEVEEAAKFGWAPQGAAAVGGHINVGRTVAPAVLTGGLSLLFGASRSKDKTTVTFVRDERWLARAKAGDAMSLLKDRQGKLRMAEEETRQARLVLENRLEEAQQNQSLERDTLEKDIEASLKVVSKALEAGRNHRQDALIALSSVRDAYSHAARVDAEVAPLTFNAETEIDRLRKGAAGETERVRRAQELRGAQEGVMRALRDWQEASKKRQKAQSTVGDADIQLTEARANADVAPAERAEKVARKVREAEAERAKRQADLDNSQIELNRCEASLRTALAQRDSLATALKESIAVPEQAELPPARTPPVSSQQVSDKAEPQEAPSDAFGQLEKLADLHRAGILTDDEFAAKKAEILSRM